ncbi:hypothetical protein DFH09DRAFT_1069650 [Mycena vulgaris]|nr:hypothetical protein DFH09DRAFT_1069650 [Mycena vulgaris]
MVGNPAGNATVYTRLSTHQYPAPVPISSNPALCHLEGTTRRKAWHSNLLQPTRRPGERDLALGIGIGQVEYIRKDAFFPMFKASAQWDATLNKFPDNFVPIEVGPVEQGSYPAGIQYVHNLDSSLMVDDNNSRTSQRCFTKYRVWRSDVVDEKPFVDYMLENYSSWTELCSGSRESADLMFITGLDVSTYFIAMSDQRAYGQDYPPVVPRDASDIYGTYISSRSVYSPADKLQNADPLQPIADYIFWSSIAVYALFGDNDIKEMVSRRARDQSNRQWYSPPNAIQAFTHRGRGSYELFQSPEE